jgi:hypothetical protein
MLIQRRKNRQYCVRGSEFSFVAAVVRDWAAGCMPFAMYLRIAINCVGIVINASGMPLRLSAVPPTRIYGYRGMKH